MACQLRRLYLLSILLLLFLAALSRVLRTHRPSYASRAVGSRQLAMDIFFRDAPELHQSLSILICS
jgi:hypothetical protein